MKAPSEMSAKEAREALRIGWQHWAARSHSLSPEEEAEDLREFEELLKVLERAAEVRRAPREAGLTSVTVERGLVRGGSYVFRGEPTEEDARAVLLLIGATRAPSDEMGQGLGDANEYRERIHALSRETLVPAPSPQPAGAEQRVRELEEAVLWALGEAGDFPPREEGQGAYWWRPELRKRAFGASRPAAPSPEPATGGRELVLALYAAENRGDREAVRSLITDAFLALSRTPRAEPGAGPEPFAHAECRVCGHPWGLHVPTLKGTECRHETRGESTSGVLGLPTVTRCKCAGYDAAPSPQPAGAETVLDALQENTAPMIHEAFDKLVRPAPAPLPPETLACPTCQHLATGTGGTFACSHCGATWLGPSPQPAGADLTWLIRNDPRFQAAYTLGKQAAYAESRPAPAPAVEEALREALVDAIAFVIRAPNRSFRYWECRYCASTWWNDRLPGGREQHARGCLVPRWRALLTETREGSGE
jgi:hypothetical protein